ncbi:hypothetical protein D9615_007497 [Tricholomella constricta]|uniref:BTB domain-containing protein n=1 Tax=Tricholomella constricta TaxID=117010 RepID=A0A8H5H7J3_9AGAR|nr:hypothetical protein D9615_007497 [Tricholomella constricta]
MTAPCYSKIDNVLTRSVVSSKKFHPEFSFPDADVILRSFEGTLYRIHSYTLRTTSGLFDTMFNLPQPPRCKNGIQGQREQLGPEEYGEYEPEEIPIYESDFVLERLLRLLCSIPVPSWESYDDVDRVLTAAEKWDTPGPIASIRAVLTCPQFLTSDPLRLYVLAKHFDWREEAKLASTQTLKLNLHDAIHASTLAKLSSKDLLPLLNLHRKRRDMFKKLIDSPERFAAGNSRCGVTQLDNHTWREFKNAMFAEIDRRPLADTLGLAVGQSAEWPEAKACWEAKCTKEGCGGLNYDRIATLRQIRNCIDLLPSTIED